VSQSLLIKVGTVYKYEKISLMKIFKASDLILAGDADLQQRKDVLIFECYLPSIDNLEITIYVLEVFVPHSTV